MNRTQTLAVVVFTTLLPLAQTALASDREHGDRGHGRTEHARGHDYGHGHNHGRHNYRRHHNSHHHTQYCRHDHDSYSHDAGHYSHNNQRAHVVLPFPPLPPFPVIVLNRKHHFPHIELHHSR